MTDDRQPATDGLRLRLLALIQVDDRLRTELLRDGTLFEGYNARMAQLHARNARDLEAIIEAVGWPGLVGPAGAEAASRVLQHAIGSPADGRQAAAGLPSLVEQQQAMRESAAREGERPPAD